MPRDHTLRAIRAITDPVLLELLGELDQLCARPSIALEKFLRGLLLHVLYTIPCEWLLGRDVASALFEGVVARLCENYLLTDEHFTVGGTLLEAWAEAKSFRRKRKWKRSLDG